MIAPTKGINRDRLAGIRSASVAPYFASQVRVLDAETGKLKRVEPAKMPNLTHRQRAQWR